MKFTLFIVLLSARLLAQPILPERDSLPITKPKQLGTTYNTHHAALGEISITTRGPKAVNAIPRKFLGNLTGGILTLFSGITTSSSDETLWVSENELVSTEATHTLHVPLFFPGEWTKDRERVKNEDGSFSVETTKGVHVDWRKGAYGLILEEGDSAGGFSVNVNLLDDTTSLHWLSQLRAEGMAVTDKLKYFYQGQGYSFKVEGVFRGRSFSMYTASNYYRSLIAIENEPVAVFQSEPSYVAVGKKARLSPYILFSKRVVEEDKINLIRLAFLNSLLGRCLSTDFYEK